jgi:hypothetical protein
LVPFDRSEVAIPYGACSFAIKIWFSCIIFRILRVGVVSLLCALIRHLVPVRGSKAEYFSIVFTMEINESSG